MNNYKTWLDSDLVTEELKNEIRNYSEKEIEESFSTNLEFGTAGMRALIGAGTAKMNEFTVKKATYGLGLYLTEKFKTDDKIKVAIAYDSRHFSREFAEHAASVLAYFDIYTLIYKDERPTPMLSFLVREQQCQAGIVITASHNPKEYQGYKVYNPSGAQLNLDEGDELIKKVESVTDLFNINTNPDYKSFVTYIDESYDDVYLDAISDIMINEDVARNVSVVFTPEHGTSGVVIPKAFKKFGFTNLIEVEEQMNPDPNFTNTKSSNPEEIEAYELAIKYGEKNNADLIIANDPDADRLGIMVNNGKNEFIALSGNQTGAIMIDYILTHRNLNGNEILYKTIVTGEMGGIIAKDHNVEVKELLTGFKFIGDAILNLETKGIDSKYIFGYEESYGYLIKDCVRDKDAISASILITEIVSYYKQKGLTLVDVLNGLYEKYGYYSEITHSLTLSGMEGMQKIKDCIAYVKKTDIDEILGIKVTKKIDYSKGVDSLPKSDVVKFYLEDTGWIVFRPSGTEPKLKIYISVKDDSVKTAEELNLNLFNEMKKLV